MLRKFPWNKINGTKNGLFFFASPNSSQFTFTLRFLYELKHQVCLSKSGKMGFSILDSDSFLLKFVFLFNKMHGLFDFKTA